MKKLISLGLCMIFVLTACMPSLGGGSTTQETQPQGEVDVVGTSVALTMAADVEPAAPVVIEPTNTLAPAEPPTNTPVPELTGTTTINANCRSGPGTNYEVLIVVPLGTIAKIIGKNQQAMLWYQLELADGKQCWVSEEGLTASGDTSDVRNVAAPPTATAKPKPSWAGTWSMFQWLNNSGSST